MTELGCPVHEHGQTGMLGDIADLLAGAEAVHHGKGWDNSPAMFYLVCDDPDVPHRPLDVVTFPLGTVRHPRDELMSIGQALKDPQGKQLLRAVTRHAPVSCFVVIEAWERVVVDKTMEEEQAERAGRMLADIPGSVEIRMAFAVVGENLLMVRRKRGEKPRFMRSGLDADGAAFDGAMVESLRAVNQAVRAAFHEEHGCDCGEKLRKTVAKYGGGDAVVSTAPPLVDNGFNRALICPHGNTYYAEPKGTP